MLQCIYVCFVCTLKLSDDPHLIGVAVCCSVLQYVAVYLCMFCVHVGAAAPHRCCSVLQCVAVCCSVSQFIAVCCSVLQCVAVCCSVL